MSLAIVIPPYADVIHREEAKEHLKIESATTADDELIDTQIAIARNTIETASGANRRRSNRMLATTYDLKLDYFPNSDHIWLPRGPLISVTSITYVDANGTTQTMTSTDYVADLANSKIDLAYSEVWPTTRPDYNAVTVRFVAGMAATFTAATTDICTFQGRSFTVGDRVRLLNSGGALPAGLSALTDYFVITDDKLALTSGGSAVDITGTGTGTHYVTLNFDDFESMRHAIKLELGRLYFHRGDDDPGYDVTQRAIDSLVASSM